MTPVIHLYRMGIPSVRVYQPYGIPSGYTIHHRIWYTIRVLHLIWYTNLMVYHQGIPTLGYTIVYGIPSGYTIYGIPSGYTNLRVYHTPSYMVYHQGIPSYMVYHPSGNTILRVYHCWKLDSGVQTMMDEYGIPTLWYTILYDLMVYHRGMPSYHQGTPSYMVHHRSGYTILREYHCWKLDSWVQTMMDDLGSIDNWCAHQLSIEPKSSIIVWTQLSSFQQWYSLRIVYPERWCTI